MRKTISLAIFFLVVLLIGAHLCQVWIARHRTPTGYSLGGKEIVCAMELDAYSDASSELRAGLNYELLHRFADSLGTGVEIVLSMDGEEYLDSLQTGTVDIVVLPDADSCSREDILRSESVCGTARWVVAGDNEIAMEEINAWLKQYDDSEQAEADKRLYLKALNNPFLNIKAGVKRRVLSPYDSLFRAYSVRLGWEWRRLAALVYQESRFHIEALSRRGATGLMQMMPRTADRYEREKMLDPEENIRAGVEYLNSIKRLFSGQVREDQLYLFMLAAYNAGEGRIMDCINYARYKNVYDSTWASVCAVIPEMADEAVASLDTIKVGRFQGRETLVFVDNIMALEEAFETICP